MFRVFILDDEQSAITLLKHKLTRNFPDGNWDYWDFWQPFEGLEDYSRVKAWPTIYWCRYAASYGLNFRKNLNMLNRTSSSLQLIMNMLLKLYESRFDYLVKPIRRRFECNGEVNWKKKKTEKRKLLKLMLNPW